MTNRRDRLRESQGGGNQRTQLPIIKALEAKKVNEIPSFRAWNKELGEHGENEIFTKPIQGILIGTAQFASAYDDNLGRNGGTYNSAFYFADKKGYELAIFDNVGKVAVSGTKEVVDAWVNENTTEHRLKVVKVLLILTASGMVSVKTNISLFIDNINGFDKDTFLDYMMVLTPVMYDPNDKNNSASLVKHLGKFAPKNPPCYAKISKGLPISYELSVEMGEDAAVAIFKKYKEEKTAGKEVSTEPEQEFDHDLSQQEEESIANLQHAPPHSTEDIPPELEEHDETPF